MMKNYFVIIAVVERKCLPDGKWERSKYVRKYCKRVSSDDFRKRFNDLVFSTFHSKHEEIKQVKRNLHLPREHITHI